MTTRTATYNTARLVARIENAEVRWADSGDHWPGYDEEMTLRRGYWIGDDRRHDWAGRSKVDVKIEAIARGAVDPESGEAAVRWF
jgi:hypothetical protein